jgi:hypothetical protein
MSVGHSIYSSFIYSLRYVLRRGVKNDAEACPPDNEVSFPLRHECEPVTEDHAKYGISALLERESHPYT